MAEFGFATEHLRQVETLAQTVESIPIPRRRPPFPQPVRVRPSVDDPLRAEVAGSVGAYLVRVFWNRLGFDEHRKFAWRLEHKLVQATLFNRYTGGAFPRSWGLAMLLRRRLREPLLDALATGRLFVKRALGHLSGDWGSADSTARVLRNLLAGADLTQHGEALTDETWIVQERIPIGSEYRVHSFEDVVVPGLTFDRYGPSPIPLRRDAINRYVQTLLDRLPDALVGESLYAWDIAVTKDGNPRVIEVNLAGFHPVYERGFQVSGFFQYHQLGPPLLAELTRRLFRTYNLGLELPDEWDAEPARHALFLRILRHYLGRELGASRAGDGSSLPAEEMLHTSASPRCALAASATGTPEPRESHPPRLDGVLCLRPDQWRRFELLRRSLGRFGPDVGILWVATLDEDYKEIAAAVAGPKTVVLPEAELVPEAASSLEARPGIRRQVAKLAMVEGIASDFCLDLSADVLCVRPFRLADLVLGGKGLYYRYINSVHESRYVEAEAVLGLPRSGWVHGSIPYLLSKPVVRALTDFLAARAASVTGAHWRRFLLDQPAWILGFVYFTFLEAFRLDEVYHVPADHSLYDNCVWSAEEWSVWDPKASFGGQDEFIFSVVQTGPGVPEVEIWERVEPFLRG